MKLHSALCPNIVSLGMLPRINIDYTDNMFQGHFGTVQSMQSVYGGLEPGAKNLLYFQT